ncbi:hypothetical protein F7731_21640 [Cytobacillus depressus]|uniref:Uncharacterized protein n=1 Tax=Cytobacillus depressus TaxID=1602942 RepID=A0A6L3UZ22_9BACI|nr:hypothetical protein [Cytobacillus depressus]KAB2329749.1 hypothetical protein F7731_21640 [Cytobacillus depressus]
MGAWMVGPFLIKYEWILLLMAGLFSYFFMKSKTKSDRTFQEYFFNTILNAVIFGFLIFKFSTVLFRPSILFDQPLSVLYMSGGIKGILLGLFIAIIYISFKCYKGNWAIKSWMTVIVYGIVTFFIALWTLRTLFFLFIRLQYE